MKKPPLITEISLEQINLCLTYLFRESEDIKKALERTKKELDNKIQDSLVENQW